MFYLYLNSKVIRCVTDHSPLITGFRCSRLTCAEQRGTRQRTPPLSTVSLSSLILLRQSLGGLIWGWRREGLGSWGFRQMLTRLRFSQQTISRKILIGGRKGLSPVSKIRSGKPNMWLYWVAISRFGIHFSKEKWTKMKLSVYAVRNEKAGEGKQIGRTK